MYLAEPCQYLKTGLTQLELFVLLSSSAKCYSGVLIYSVLSHAVVIVLLWTRNTDVVLTWSNLGQGHRVLETVRLYAERSLELSLATKRIKSNYMKGHRKLGQKIISCLPFRLRPFEGSDNPMPQWWEIFPQPMEVSGLLQPLVWVILRWKTLRTGSPLPWGLSISASKSASRFEKRSTFDCKKLFWGCGRLNGTLFKGFEQKNKFCTQELGF